MKNIKKIQYKKGAAMITVVFFFMFISLTILVGVVGPVLREFKIANENFSSKKSYFTAESGIEDIVYRLKNNMDIEASEELVIDDSSTITTITNITSKQKEVISHGNSNEAERKLSITVNTGVGASFNYGVQAGIGGFVMDNNSEIVGSVYSNGSITGLGKITGSAISANSSAISTDQENGSGIPPYDVTFGNATNSQDYAESFHVSKTEVINKIDLYIKKVGNPSNITVRIVNDNNGSPGQITLAMATLSASIVSTSYGWVDVPLDSNPQLSSNLTYWFILDSSISPSKYYKIGANDGGYTGGTSKIGEYEGSWSNLIPSSLDGFFKIYLGGLTGLIDGIEIGTGTGGSAFAHTVNNSIIEGTNYCQTGSGNNKQCDTSKVDPVQIAMPISEQNILDWKSIAETGGTYEGNYTVSENITMGPKKIEGNLTVDGGKTLTMSGTIWVTGNLVVNNNSIMKLTPDYSTSEGVIIVDGTITISNNSTFQGSGATGSYMMALTTSSSSSAINLSNNAGAVSLYAANGTINVANNGTAKALTGHYIHLNENAVITYDDGLANANFIGGPSGSWNISSWKEIE